MEHLYRVATIMDKSRWNPDVMQRKTDDYKSTTILRIVVASREIAETLNIVCGVRGKG